MKSIINNDRDVLAALDDLEINFCKASNNTLSEYYKTGQRLISRKTDSETPIDVLLKAKSKNTFYKWINGFRFYVCRAIRDNLVLYEENSKYKLALITIALTGCRPCKLKKDIKISTSDGRIHFFIEGAKVDEKKGQPHRTISYSLISDNPIIERLINGPLSVNEDITVSIEKAVNFSVEVRRISKILWPRHKESITCYCFRHQFSSDMKKKQDG